jgi:hypothetical protein
MRIVTFHQGDYGDAYRRVRTGNQESYRDQRRTVDSVASLATKHEVTTIAVCDRSHDEVLAPGLQSIGVPKALVWDPRRLWPLLDKFDPEAFIGRAPNRFALAWAAEKRIPVLPTIADTFTTEGWWNRLITWLLGDVVHRFATPGVTNLSRSAPECLNRLGPTSEQSAPQASQTIKPTGDHDDPRRRDAQFRSILTGMLTQGTTRLKDARSKRRAGAHHVFESGRSGPARRLGPQADLWLFLASIDARKRELSPIRSTASRSARAQALLRSGESVGRGY